MKKLWGIVLLLCSSPVWAQEAALAANPVTAASPVAPEASAPQTPNAPENIPTSLQPNAGDFPPLPPARPCARPDADGLWQLRYVFEKPRGPTSADFANNPYQYILFLRDDTYRTFKEVWGEKTPDEVKNELESTPPEHLQQFVVHESGMVFFYVDGQNIDSQACFIVANERGVYAPGQMILMPPEGRIATRLALVYERIMGQPVVQANPEEPYTPRRQYRRK